MTVSGMRPGPLPLGEVGSIDGPVFLALGAFILLLGQLQLELVGGVILADLALGALVAWWFLVPRFDLGRTLGRALIGPLLLILVGTLVAMFHIGLASWAVRDLALDLGAILGFLAVAAVAGRADERHWIWIARLLMISLGLVALQLTTDGGGELRSSAGFPNPNLAAHFVVTVTAVALHLQHRRRDRLIVLGLGALGWLATGSFGALLQAATMVAFRLWRRVGAATLAGVTAAGATMAAAVVWVVSSGFGSSLTFGGLSTDRLGRSSDGRFQKWVEGLLVLERQPTGVGPGSVDALALSNNELHNEPLAFLVERGPLALLGLGLFYLVLWLAARPGGVARMLIIGFVVASLFRETSHYRHLWLGLALILAWERFHDDGCQPTVARRVDPVTA